MYSGNASVLRIERNFMITTKYIKMMMQQSVIKQSNVSYVYTHKYIVYLKVFI